MRHGSLFSGIGGFDLAAEWMGWENVFHCEWMEFPRKVLDYHFPDADSHIDICKTDFTKYANTIDIISGGFPCQPFSLAGKRKGTDDERYLWGEMLRAIQEIKPRFVIAENVFGITNIDGGLVFQQVCLDLENEGYEVQPFIIPAAAKNAPHRRDRCWFIANRKDIRYGSTKTIDERGKPITQDGGEIRDSFDTNGIIGNVANTKCNGSSIGKLGESQTKQQVQTGSDIDGFESLGNATNTNCDGLNKRNSNDEINTSQGGQYAFNDIEQIPTDSKCIGRTEIRDDNGQFKTPQQSECRKQQFSGADSAQSWWRDFPSQSPICGGDDGLPTQLDGITFSKWRAESIKGYGNAIVPQIAYQLFQIINDL
jgi:DNA (cytosine-5)-methyltransferase 1